jgi:hypothetical protein
VNRSCFNGWVASVKGGEQVYHGEDDFNDYRMTPPAGAPWMLMLTNPSGN